MWLSSMLKVTSHSAGLSEKCIKIRTYKKNTRNSGRWKVWLYNSLRSPPQVAGACVQPSWRRFVLNHPSLTGKEGRELGLCIAVHASPPSFRLPGLLALQATSSAPERPAHVFVNIVADRPRCPPGVGLETTNNSYCCTIIRKPQSSPLASAEVFPGSAMGMTTMSHVRVPVINAARLRSVSSGGLLKKQPEQSPEHNRKMETTHKIPSALSHSKIQ